MKNMTKSVYYVGCQEKNIMLNRENGLPYCQILKEDCPRQYAHRAERRFKKY